MKCINAIFHNRNIPFLSSYLSRPLSSLSHVDVSKSLPCMVDVSSKEETLRTAEARAFITLPNEAFALIDTHTNDKAEINSAKGPVFSTGIAIIISAYSN